MSGRWGEEEADEEGKEGLFFNINPNFTSHFLFWTVVWSLPVPSGLFWSLPVPSGLYVAFHNFPRGQ